MKILHLVSFCSLFLTTLQAEPPVKFEGLAGIPFGSDAEQVKAAMDARGSTLSPTKSTTGHVEFEGGTFNNEPVGSWHFYFFAGKLYKASVRIGTLGMGDVPAYERFKKSITEKYGTPFQDTKIDLEPAELWDLLKKGKVELEANWRVEGTRNSVTCQLSRSPTGGMAVRVTYQNDAVEAQVASQQKGDI